MRRRRWRRGDRAVVIVDVSPSMNARRSDGDPVHTRLGDARAIASEEGLGAVQIVPVAEPEGVPSDFPLSNPKAEKPTAPAVKPLLPNASIASDVSCRISWTMPFDDSRSPFLAASLARSPTSLIPRRP